MARHKCIGIRQKLTTLLPKAEIERLAHESGAVRRRRKVDASAMLWTVLLGFGTGRERTLAGLRRTYDRVTGKSLVPSSFYDRFSTELAGMFRAVLRELMTKLAASEVRYSGVLEGFRDVLNALRRCGPHRGQRSRKRPAVRSGDCLPERHRRRRRLYQQSPLSVTSAFTVSAPSVAPVRLGEDAPSAGRVQAALRRLERLRLADTQTGDWILDDPELAAWIRENGEWHFEW